MGYNEQLGQAMLLVAKGRAVGLPAQVRMDHWDWERPATGWTQVYRGTLPPTAELCSVRLQAVRDHPDGSGQRSVMTRLWWMALELPTDHEWHCAYVFARSWEDEEMQLEYEAAPGVFTRENATGWLTRRAAVDARLLAGGECPCQTACTDHQRVYDYRTGRLKR